MSLGGAGGAAAEAGAEADCVAVARVSVLLDAEAFAAAAPPFAPRGFASGPQKSIQFRYQEHAVGQE